LKVRGGWIAWVLVLAGIARAALLVAHEPLAGYANQYDMIRSSACIGLYPDLPRPQRFQANSAAPVPRYTSDARRPDLCYPSTEVAVAWLAGSVSQAILGSQAMPLRNVGLAKLGLLAAAALILAWSLQGHRVAAIVHGLVFALVMSDPVVTLWMNSLYTEFMALWSLYAAIGALLALALGCRARHVVSALLLVALAALAFSREQFALFPIALALLAGPWLWFRSRRLAIMASVVAIGCASFAW
jgi:hypothetical protein